MEIRSSSHQLELIRRYARILRQEAAQYRGPRNGAREARSNRQGRFTREAATRAALDVVRPAKPAG